MEEVAHPGFAMSYSLAAYVDRSPTLQKLVDLGVDLSAVEANPGQADVLVKLDFDRDVAPRIRYFHFFFPFYSAQSITDLVGHFFKASHGQRSEGR